MGNTTFLQNSKNMQDPKKPTMRSLSSPLIELSVGLILVVLPLQTHALDFSPDSSRVLSDPAYLPERGQVYGATNYSYTKTTGDEYNYLGALQQSITRTSNALSQLLAYGVTDDLSLRVSVEYARDRIEHDSPTGTSATFDAYGFKDPDFGVTLRVLDQEDDFANWDLTGSFAPSLIEARDPTVAEDGTVARGGPVATLGTAISYKTKAFTAYVHADAAYLGKSEIHNSNSITTKYEPSWEYFFGIDTQTRLNDVVAINIGAAEIFKNSTEATAQGGIAPVTFNSHPGDLARVNAALVVHILSNGLATALTYDHDIYAHSSNRDAMPPAAAPIFNGTTKNESANTVGVSLLYASD